MDILSYRIKDDGAEYGKLMQVENQLDVLQELVGGYIDVLRITDDCVAVINEEASVYELPPSALVSLDEGKVLICGDFFICGRQGAEFVSITPAQVKNIKSIIKRV